MEQINKITIVGAGYVGMSLGALLAQKNDVIIYDVNHDRIKKINKNQSTIGDNDIEKFLKKKNLNLSATSNKTQAYINSNFVIIATPTNYDPKNNSFDTSHVDAVVKDIRKYNARAFIVIKSTIPVGHTKLLQKQFKTKRIIFSPEFLREGSALMDNLYPSRIIIGSSHYEARLFAKLLSSCAKKKDVPILFMKSSEAEAVKLFANTFLAMRISFFNELDSYALTRDLSTKKIIEGICLDERIGDNYNNPSFGYGGYCLPKDTKQLLANYNQTPQKLIKAIVSSNSTRKDFIAEQVLKLNPKVVGFYRLVMKEGSDNIRSSATIGILERIKSTGITTIIYEPTLKAETFNDSQIINDIKAFKEKSSLIIANRLNVELDDVRSKCFSRDVFQDN